MAATFNSLGEYGGSLGMNKNYDFREGFSDKTSDMYQLQSLWLLVLSKRLPDTFAPSLSYPMQCQYPVLSKLLFIN